MRHATRLMLERLKSTLHAAITTPKGDTLAPVRVGKDLARRLNRTLGSPVASGAELEKRRAAKARLAELRSVDAPAPRPTAARAQTPVTVYFEGVRNARMLGRIEETLAAKSIAFTKLDVTGDEATMTFVTHTAGCERDDLPVVFVGPKCVGGFDALVAADVSGELAKLL